MLIVDKYMMHIQVTRNMMEDNVLQDLTGHRSEQKCHIGTFPVTIGTFPVLYTSVVSILLCSHAIKNTDYYKARNLLNILQNDRK